MDDLPVDKIGMNGTGGEMGIVDYRRLVGTSYGIRKIGNGPKIDDAVHATSKEIRTRGVKGLT